jgi:large subunit ribosomal protein L15
MEDSLPKIVKGKSKRVGRGYASGKGGHTVGRGQKGQKSRKKLNILFEGVKVKKSLIKRLPLSPGKGKMKSKPKPVIVKLSLLNLLPAGSKVDIENLSKHGVVRKEDVSKVGVKVLGNGEVKKRLTICVPISKSAAKKIIKAGGKIQGVKKDQKKTRVKRKSIKGKSTTSRSKS